LGPALFFSGFSDDNKKYLAMPFFNCFCLLLTLKDKKLSKSHNIVGICFFSFVFYLLIK